jgi:hypothetical protein
MPAASVPAAKSRSWQNGFVESEETHTAPYESTAFDLLAAGNVPAAVAAITAIADSEAALEALAHLCGRAYRDLASRPKTLRCPAHPRRR